eukprot:scaffold438_cov250-Pinguiococcus_pyrenoidosus.AAC.17
MHHLAELLHAALPPIFLHVHRLALLGNDDEDSMRPGADLVHLRGARRAHGSSTFHQAVDLRWRAHHPLAEVLHVHAAALVLPDGQVVALGLEQVTDLLVVDLQVGRPDEKAHRGRRVRLDMAEDLLDRPRNDASLLHVSLDVETLHGVRLAGARLPVRKNRGVVALQRRVHHRSGRGLVHPALRRELLVHVIEGEHMRPIRTWPATGRGSISLVKSRSQILAHGDHLLAGVHSADVLERLLVV